tara:strand:+ start:67 stop:549 length:483 start_codon:yes stop_codon:yes gene_type:complete
MLDINPKTNKKYYYKDNPEAVRKRDASRMYVNGKEVSKKHPLHKPGRYKAWDDPWSHVELDTKTAQGDVYVVRNRAWPTWYKIGRALDAEDRLKTYQTGAPQRDYELVHTEWFENCHTAEKEIHKMLEQHKSCHERRNEWFKSYDSVIKEVMREYKETQG